MTHYKTTEEAQIERILTNLKEHYGEDFLLILTPSGNGNIALKQQEKCYQNILFNRLGTVLSPTTKEVH
ncbi:hypothetical protein [Vibrio vulnificus]|uniref:hypothetical protein n=1 Tax=Vibrio vulnificus TaxID=672 RepID=UPI001023A618|nr:hypothetical protein [Vibrio vulnificus]EHZ2651946.1 hypothetical protein [Vibrio vulnificus]RZQ33196.1 hypothetical protein D8T38_18305 [Vibrio vulnificus]